MGNSCLKVKSVHPSHVVSIRPLGSVDELTFTDIDDAWVIAMRDATKEKKAAKATVVKRTGWKTIRIFVSSTFRDFDAEREVLVKKVFPDLRDWCQSRRLHLVECDLRWGVPKDSTTEATLRTCLGEIDRCYSENMMPFFVNMTSERIGWIPLGNQLPDTLKSEYRWVDGLSVTEMEIMHGAYRIDNPNAIFMLRDRSFLSSVPEEYQKHFVDECTLAPYKLEKLKKAISEKFFSRVTEYKCEFAGLDKDTKMPRFKDLEENFAPPVLRFFQERIAAQYPLIDEKKQDPLDEAQTQHESFMKMASERVVGRDLLISEFVDSFVNATEELAPVIVYGGPGLGKTSIMAAFADRCTQLNAMHKLLKLSNNAAEWHIFYHFCGAVAGSTDQLNMLIRLLVEIKALDREAKWPTSLDEAMGLVRGALSNPRTKNCIVIVDAINQFDDNAGMPAPISWLPIKMSQSVRLFVSLTPESNQFKNVRESGEKWKFMELQPLDRETKERMVTSQLARYNKRLDRGQLELLLNKRSSDNPMWLALATEELRVYGRFRELTNKIGTLPDGLANLEADILGRFEREGDSRRLVATLCLLECSVFGLLESELLELLADSDLLPPALMEKIASAQTYSMDGEDQEETSGAASVTRKQNRLTASQWADIYRVLRPFMRPFGLSGEGRLDFYHRSLSKAVRNRYYYKTKKLPDGTLKQISRREDVDKWFHQKLANYFGDQCSHLERRVEEYPTHAWKSGDRDGLIKFLSRWDVFDLMYDPEFARQLSQSWERVYFLKVKADDDENDQVFKDMELTYLGIIGKEISAFESNGGNQQKLIEKMEAVTRVLGQNGRFEAAFNLSEKLIKMTFPNVGKCNSGDLIKTPFAEREYGKAGENLPDHERLRFARLVHLQASMVDEEMRQVDYMYRSHIPKILIIIESFESVIFILRKVAPKDKLLGRTLNRDSFYYSSVFHRGGCELLPRDECIKMARQRINEAIEFYTELGEGQEMNLADCYVTRGVVEPSPSNGDQRRYYQKGLDIILETAGKFHPLLDRTYLNMAINYEESGDCYTGYDYFRKWYTLLADMYGKNHPRTHRAVRTLNEPMYRRITRERGDVLPSVGVQGDEEAESKAESPTPDEDEAGEPPNDVQAENNQQQQQDQQQAQNANEQSDSSDDDFALF